MAAYGEDEEFESWLSSMGLVIPDDKKSKELRTIGSFYVDAAYEHLLHCSKRASDAQELAWPRLSDKYDDEFIPNDWIIASYRAAYLEATNPGWATGSRDISRITKREQADVFSREFFGPTELEGHETKAAPGMPVDGMIESLVSRWECKPNVQHPLFLVI